MIHLGFRSGAVTPTNRVPISVVWRRFSGGRNDNWHDGGTLHLPPDIWQRLYKGLKYIAPTFGIQIVELTSPSDGS